MVTYCDQCEYLMYDYSEDYEYCWVLSEEHQYERADGRCYCRFGAKKLKQFADEIEKAEAEYYEGFVKFMRENGYV